MSYDISIMNTGSDGRVTYRMSSMSHKIVGKDKLVQHFIKNLYDDNVGGLIKTLKEKRAWTDGDIIDSVHKTVRHMQAAQAGRRIHPDEKLSGASIKKLSTNKTEGTVDLVIAIKSHSGSTVVSL